MAAPLDEAVICFPVGDERLVGIVHPAAVAAGPGVVIVVGGPQYRVGSHRQFVLLARRLAAAGFPVLRFDYRGIGDSSGAARDFEQVEGDIEAAVGVLIAHSGVTEVVLWGLCDAASAAMMYAARDSRVSGLALANPWVHSPATEARTRLKTYYGARLRNPEFWRKLRRFEIDWRESWRSLAGYVTRALQRSGGDSTRSSDPDQGHFIERMLAGWRAYEGPTLLILSGDDLTAAEFEQLCSESPAWGAALARPTVRRVALAAANHTFASADWRAQVEQATLEWLGDQQRGGHPSPAENAG